MKKVGGKKVATARWRGALEQSARPRAIIQERRLDCKRRAELTRAAEKNGGGANCAQLQAKSLRPEGVLWLAESLAGAAGWLKSPDSNTLYPSLTILAANRMVTRHGFEP